MDQSGLPTTESAMLLKQGLEQMEADIKAGTTAADMVFTSLAEMDAYYFSAKQAADGKQVTGVVFRTRVPPYLCFAVAPIVAFQPESMRILNARLPPPPPPSKAPASGKTVLTPDARQSAKADRARKAGAAARAAAASSHAEQSPQPSPGSMPLAPPPGMVVPPPLDDEGVPQG